LKTALITGITGQDGAYLTELLLSKGYKVYGAYRRVSTVNFWRLDSLGVLNDPNLILIEFDLTDLANCISVVKKTKPDEIYNLAAQSFVAVSFDQPIATSQITALGPLNILEAIRILNKKIKFYQASSSEMFGHVQKIPQTENTDFYPRSPYGISKLYAHWMTINYKESYDIFSVSGILFNHESPLRGKEFVTRKITNGVAKIKLGLSEMIELGNLDAKRDWGYAKEYVEGMWLMLQAEKPDNYVLATNSTETIRNFVDISFQAAGIEIKFEGKGQDEKAFDVKTGRIVMQVNPEFYRPAEVNLLIGDYSKAKEKLGWSPKTNLKNLSKMMVEEDLKRLTNNV